MSTIHIVCDTLEKIFVSYGAELDGSAKTYCIGRTMGFATLKYLDQSLLYKESGQIVAELIRRLKLGKRLNIVASSAIGAENARFWCYINYTVQFVLEANKCEFYFTDNNNNQILVAEIKGLVLSFHIDNLAKYSVLGSVPPTTKYYVASYEPDMLFERFVVANKIRMNGGWAFYEIDDRSREEIKLDGDINDWVLVSIDRELYRQGRCNIYRYKYGPDQIEGEVYIDNVGKLRHM